MTALVLLAQSAPPGVDAPLIAGFALFGVALVLFALEFVVPSAGLLSLLCTLSIAAGVFFPRLQYLRHFSRQPIPGDRLTFQPGVRMVRFWEEIFDYPGRSTRTVGLSPHDALAGKFNC